MKLLCPKIIIFSLFQNTEEKDVQNNVTVVLYVCETWSLTLITEHCI
jgi:hypothetical protein